MSTKTLFIFLLISVIPVDYVISLDYEFYSSSSICETFLWDGPGCRFLVSFIDGGIGQVSVPNNYSSSSPGPGTTVFEEMRLLNVTRNGTNTMGLAIDRPRNRIVVAFTDIFARNFSAVAAYDLNSFKRLFLTKLTRPRVGYGKTLANSVALDAEGNAYISDSIANKIWKVSAEGQPLPAIRSPLFIPKAWNQSLIGLNGMVYHPDGFLIVINTNSGALFKIDIINISKGKKVKLIKVLAGAGPLSLSLLLGDGLALVSPTKLVVAGTPTARLLESSDGWETACVVATFNSSDRPFSQAATVKDGTVYLGQVLGLAGSGNPKPNEPNKFTLIEAVF